MHHSSTNRNLILFAPDTLAPALTAAPLHAAIHIARGILSDSARNVAPTSMTVLFSADVPFKVLPHPRIKGRAKCPLHYAATNPTEYRAEGGTFHNFCSDISAGALSASLTKNWTRWT